MVQFKVYPSISGAPQTVTQQWRTLKSALLAFAYNLQLEFPQTKNSSGDNPFERKDYLCNRCR